jgi:hypothetical protein
MFNSPYVEDTLAQIKQDELVRELKTSGTIWLKGTKKYKKLSMLGFLMALVWLVLH